MFRTETSRLGTPYKTYRHSPCDASPVSVDVFYNEKIEACTVPEGNTVHLHRVIVSGAPGVLSVVGIICDGRCFVANPQWEPDVNDRRGQGVRVLPTQLIPTLDVSCLSPVQREAAAVTLSPASASEKATRMRMRRFISRSPM